MPARFTLMQAYGQWDGGTTGVPHVLDVKHNFFALQLHPFYQMIQHETVRLMEYILVDSLLSSCVSLVQGTDQSGHSRKREGENLCPVHVQIIWPTDAFFARVHRVSATISVTSRRNNQILRTAPVCAHDKRHIRCLRIMLKQSRSPRIPKQCGHCPVSRGNNFADGVTYQQKRTFTATARQQ